MSTDWGLRNMVQQAAIDYQ